MDYKWDVFISYRRESVLGEWVKNVFYPYFQSLLPEALFRPAEIYFDQTGIPAGTDFPSKLAEGLLHSRCMVAFWCPSYFFNTPHWCRWEWEVFLRREQRHGFRTPANPHGLVVPVVLFDGKSFPDRAQKTQFFDCTRYCLPNLKKLKLYGAFCSKMIGWLGDVVAAIQRAPACAPEWKDDLNQALTELKLPLAPLPFSPPLLG